MSGWWVRIGAHTDELTELEELKRWPVITSSRKLARNMSFSSPFGGLVYFESPGASSLSLVISNVVEAPFIDLTQPESIKDWNRRRLAPAPWYIHFPQTHFEKIQLTYEFFRAELAGENIIFTAPSSCIRDIKNPVELIKYWDTVVAGHHALRGSNVKGFRRERLVNDVQPIEGRFSLIYSDSLSFIFFKLKMFSKGLI